MKTIKFIGGRKGDSFGQIFGGTLMTNYCYMKAFENDEDYKIIDKYRPDFKSAEEIKEFFKGADITHVDDTAILEMMFKAGMDAPDVIGPISRSPIKDYHGWKSKYDKDWFYKARVIRLNYNEEPNNHELVSLIRHGIDTDLIKPNPKKKKYVLWAGDIMRDAKNFEMFEEIMAITTLPAGYEWKIMTGYNVEDYWDVLDETAILVNTSKYESFCCALFEAKAKGVITINRRNLQGEGFFEGLDFQTEYNPESYECMITAILSDGRLEKLGKESRDYAVKNASLKAMKEDYKKIYGLIK